MKEGLNCSYGNGNIKQIKVTNEKISQRLKLKTRQLTRHKLKKEELKITMCYKKNAQIGEKT